MCMRSQKRATRADRARDPVVMTALSIAMPGRLSRRANLSGSGHRPPPHFKASHERRLPVPESSIVPGATATPGPHVDPVPSNQY